jgi:CubicO group peptidase (beta-lactamase class C family)
MVMRVLIFCSLILSPAIGWSDNCTIGAFSTAKKVSKEWSEGVDEKIKSLLEDTSIPGLEILIGKTGGELIKHKAYGSPKNTRVERDAIEKGMLFDLASITKVFTSTVIMRLIEDEKLKLDTKVHTILRKFQNKTITIEQLLRHTSGLIPGVPGVDKLKNATEIMNYIHEASPNKRYSGKFRYGDLNFILLGKIAESLTRKRLSTLLADYITSPLKLDRTYFKPKRKDVSLCVTHCMPTRDYFTRKILKGTVHDPTSQKLGGVAGSAGTFSRALDLAKFARFFINDYENCENMPLKRDSVEKMVKLDSVSKRGLGVDISSNYSEWMTGDFFTKGRSFGHSGFTGTGIWIDPEKEMYIIVLTNAVYSKNYRSDKREFRKVFTEIVNSLESYQAE